MLKSLKIVVNSIWAYFVLLHWSGPSSDGYGYSATLSLPGWTPPLAGEAEYANSIWIQLLYRIPYAVYGLVLAAAGSGLRDFLVQHVRWLKGLRWYGEVFLATCLIYLVPILNDLGVALRFWDTGVWFAWVDWLWPVQMLLELWLPMGLACGLSSMAVDSLQNRAGHGRSIRAHDNGSML